MASKLVPVTADKVLDLWKAGLVVGEDGYPWRKWDVRVAASSPKTLFDYWGHRVKELLLNNSAYVFVEEDAGE